MIEPTKAVMRAAENIQEDEMLLELRSLALAIDRETGLPELIESLQELVSAIGEYRHWFDTCTRTLAKDWEELAAGASVRLDSAISAARKRGNNA